jgi:AraC-like DNA-binding protein
VTTDTLSEILAAVRLKGAVFFEVEASAPWVAEAPCAALVAPSVMPSLSLQAGHVMEYHVVTHGACWATIVGRDIPPVQLAAGDVVAFPQGDAHILSSAPGMRGAVAEHRFEFADGLPVPVVLNVGGGGTERAHIVCGFLGCDPRPFNPLIEALPPILHLRASPGSNWLEGFMRFALMEANEKRMGASQILSRLGEVMFADLVRRYVESLPEGSQGWLGGLRDRHVGRALNLLHAEPARGWTLDELARESGLSRSSFAERFTDFVGTPPMQYLQRWRLQMAASKLLAGAPSIAAVARRPVMNPRPLSAGPSSGSWESRRRNGATIAAPHRPAGHRRR